MQRNGIHHVTAIAGPAARNVGILHAHARAAAGEEDGQFRRSRHLPSLLWRRAGAARDDPHLLPVGARRSRQARRRPDPGDHVQGARGRHRLVAGSPRSSRVSRIADRPSASARPCSRSRIPTACSLSLVGVPGAEAEPAWSDGTIPAEHAIRGFHGVSLLQADAAPTGAILSDVFGLAEIAREGSLVRYAAADAALGGIVDIEVDRRLPAGADGRRLGPPHRLSRRGRWRAGQDGRAAGARASHPHHRAEGPQLLPLGLLPRARRHPVRDRHRRSGLRRRRAGGLAGPGAEAAPVPGARTAARSRRRCRRSA